MIELVVFDMAGTTVYDDVNAVNASFRAALRSAGIDADPEFVKTVMGLHKPEAIRVLLERYPREGKPSTTEEIDAIHNDFVRRMRDFYLHSPEVREVPNAAATFAQLRRAGIKVALNTGFNRTISEVLLQRLGWTVPEIIDADVASDEVAHPRPAPDMIRHLMNKLNITDPRRIAKVGDTRVDLEEGTNAGCSLVVGVTTGAFTREQLMVYPHTHIVDSVTELLRLMGREDRFIGSASN